MEIREIGVLRWITPQRDAAAQVLAFQPVHDQAGLLGSVYEQPGGAAFDLNFELRPGFGFSSAQAS